MQGLDHPNIVRIIDFGFKQPVSKGRHKFVNFIVLDLCHNGSLWDHLIMNGPLSEEESIKYFTQLL